MRTFSLEGTGTLYFVEGSTLFDFKGGFEHVTFGNGCGLFRKVIEIPGTALFEYDEDTLRQCIFTHKVGPYEVRMSFPAGGGKNHVQVSIIRDLVHVTDKHIVSRNQQTFLYRASVNMDKLGHLHEQVTSSLLSTTV